MHSGTHIICVESLTGKPLQEASQSLANPKPLNYPALLRRIDNAA